MSIDEKIIAWLKSGITQSCHKNGKIKNSFEQGSTDCQLVRNFQIFSVLVRTCLSFFKFFRSWSGTNRFWSVDPWLRGFYYYRGERILSLIHSNLSKSKNGAQSISEIRRLPFSVYFEPEELVLGYLEERSSNRIYQTKWLAYFLIKFHWQNIWCMQYASYQQNNRAEVITLVSIVLFLKNDVGSTMMLVTDVDDNMCWRHFEMLVTVLPNRFGSFSHQHPLYFTISVGYQQPKDVTNIEILSLTSTCHQHPLITNIFSSR